MSFETVTSALHPYKLRMLGRDRARAICPVCGERNPNTLSVGVTTEGAVLLKCFKLECNIESICATLGLEVSDLFPPRGSQATRLQPRRLLTPAQAIELWRDDAQFVALCACNIAHGVALTDDDRAGCLSAAGRIAYLADEVHS